MSYFPVVLTFTNLVRQKLLSDFSNVLKLPDFLHFCFQTHTEFFKNNFRNLIHQITDICRCGMIPVDHESTVFFGYLGAAYLAGLAVGYWESVGEIRKQWQAEHIFEPVADRTQIAKAVAGWEDAVRRVLREKND